MFAVCSRTALFDRSLGRHRPSAVPARAEEGEAAARLAGLDALAAAYARGSTRVGTRALARSAGERRESPGAGVVRRRPIPSSRGDERLDPGRRGRSRAALTRFAKAGTYTVFDTRVDTTGGERGLVLVFGPGDRDERSEPGEEERVAALDGRALGSSATEIGYLPRRG